MNAYTETTTSKKLPQRGNTNIGKDGVRNPGRFAPKHTINDDPDDRLANINRNDELLANQYSMPTLTLAGARKLHKNWLDLDHWMVAPTGTLESWSAMILVETPFLSETTWLMRPYTRIWKQRNVLALAVPNIRDINQRMLATYSGLPETLDMYRFWIWDRTERQQGLRPDPSKPSKLAPWNYRPEYQYV